MMADGRTEEAWECHSSLPSMSFRSEIEWNAEILVFCILEAVLSEYMLHSKNSTHFLFIFFKLCHQNKQSL